MKTASEDKMSQSSQNLIEEFVSNLKERLNLAFNMALNHENNVDNAEQCFREPYEALIQLHCNNLAADQQVNFAKIWYYRGDYGRALAHIKQATDVYSDMKTKANTVYQLKQMCGQLLERGTTHHNVDILDLVAMYYSPQDYRDSMMLTVKTARQSNNPGKQEKLKQLLTGLPLELLRQGILYLKAGKIEDGKTLLSAALPYLNAKRAEIVKKQLEELDKKDE